MGDSRLGGVAAALFFVTLVGVGLIALASTHPALPFVGLVAVVAAARAAYRAMDRSLHRRRSAQATGDDDPAAQSAPSEPSTASMSTNDGRIAVAVTVGAALLSGLAGRSPAAALAVVASAIGGALAAVFVFGVVRHQDLPEP